MPILLQTEHAENVIVFMNGFAEITSLLLVPPIAIRISELSWLPRRIDVTAILAMRFSLEPSMGGLELR